MLIDLFPSGAFPALIQSEDNLDAWPRFSLSKPIAVIGTGVMGSKVAWSCARAGLATRLFDIDVARASAALEAAIAIGDCQDAQRVAENLEVSVTLDAALDCVQLAYENVPENFELKRSVLGDIGARLGADAYIGSNTSSMLCTPLAATSGRSARFLNMNFSDPVRAAASEHVILYLMSGLVCGWVLAGDGPADRQDGADVDGDRARGERVSLQSFWSRRRAE